jgi:hypothetical protein
MTVSGAGVISEPVEANSIQCGSPFEAQDKLKLSPPKAIRKCRSLNTAREIPL